MGEYLSENDMVAMQARIAELEAEVERLRGTCMCGMTPPNHAVGCIVKAGLDIGARAEKERDAYRASPNVGPAATPGRSSIR